MVMTMTMMAIMMIYCENGDFGLPVREEVYRKKVGDYNYIDDCMQHCQCIALMIWVGRLERGDYNTVNNNVNNNVNNDVNNDDFGECL